VQFKLLCSEQAPIGSSALHTSSILLILFASLTTTKSRQQVNKSAQTISVWHKQASHYQVSRVHPPLARFPHLTLFALSHSPLSLSLSFTSQRRKQQKENCFVRSEWLITPYLTYQNAHTNETTTTKKKRKYGT
jgi:hypothetical protein